MHPKAPSSSLRHGPVCSTHGSKGCTQECTGGALPREPRVQGKHTQPRGHTQPVTWSSTSSSRSSIRNSSSDTLPFVAASCSKVRPARNKPKGSLQSGKGGPAHTLAIPQAMNICDWNSFPKDTMLKMGMSGWDNHSTHLASQGLVGVRMPKFTSQVPHLSAMLSWACYLYLSELLVSQIRIIWGYCVSLY